MKEGRIQKRRLFIGLCLVLTFALLFAFQAGCSGDSGNEGELYGSDFEAKRRWVLENYFSPELIESMRSDSESLIGNFRGLNVFTTSHYGDRFIVGTVDIKDVFDARIPQNYNIFLQYARDNNLIQNLNENDQYYAYSIAAARFVQEFEFDGVLFHPDEYHPVLTRKTDTWLFLREDPAVPGQPYYYSGRIDSRTYALSGGINMEPLKNVEYWMFYIPTVDKEYTSYSYIDPNPYHGSADPGLLNNYTPKDASDEIVRARQKLGIAPSWLSGRKNLAVGGWKSSSYSDDIIRIGFSFSGDETKYTWGGNGHYLIPLDESFWN